MRIVVALLFLVSFLVAKESKKIDDWELNLTKTYQESIMQSAPMGGVVKTMAAPMMKRTVGLATGGAKDTQNFMQNIKNGYLPRLSSIAYEGLFYDHYFDFEQKQACKVLFCPTFEMATQRNLFTGEKEYFLSVGLSSGLDASKLKRKPLNLVIVLDISGSMSAPFDRYYYDKKTKAKEKKSKMEVATQAIAAMTKHLHDNDRFGVVLFDDRAYLAKPLRKVGLTDMNAIRNHILALKPRGGTNWSAGYKEALRLYAGVQKEGYENRIVFLTDAMPNRGRLSKEGLFGLTKSAASKGVHTTFIGVGVDFNPDLVKYVSRVRGANYYSVHSSKDFAKRLDKEFLYMVTPLVYDLRLDLDSKGFQIDAIYGSPEANRSTGELMHVNTLFASENGDEGVRGGVILLKLKKVADNDKMVLNVSYLDTEGKRHQNRQTVSLSSLGKKENYFESDAIRKAILLSEYTTLLQNWLIDARAHCNGKAETPPIVLLKARCMIYPPMRPEFPKLSQWEQRSCPLKVSDGYKKLFSLFAQKFQKEMKAIGDESLQKESKVLQHLSNLNTSSGGKRDDRLL